MIVHLKCMCIGISAESEHARNVHIVYTHSNHFLSLTATGQPGSPVFDAKLRWCGKTPAVISLMIIASDSCKDLNENLMKTLEGKHCTASYYPLEINSSCKRENEKSRAIFCAHFNLLLVARGPQRCPLSSLKGNKWLFPLRVLKGSYNKHTGSTMGTSWIGGSGTYGLHDCC